MTRKEEIRQASIEYTLKNRPMCICGDAFAELANELNRNLSFEEGAKWADKTIIEKACGWLREQKELIGISFQEDFIERFKIAMQTDYENNSNPEDKHLTDIWCRAQKVNRWAYIDDLLPKEGEE